ncbi:MAG: carbohydrate-binding domain-containing protein [Clostridia bacterium]|nr:carbohydrate-binding domain-containing protein [Clostridia bacterium]
MKPKSALRKRIVIALLCTSIIGTILLTGCNQQAVTSDKTSSAPSSVVTSSENSAQNSDNTNNTVHYSESSNSTVAFEDDDLNLSYDENNATKIKLSSSSAEISGKGASVKDSTITISSAGTYIISGTADNCQIEINAGKNDVVKLVLDNASLTSKTAPAIYSSKAKKTIILLPDGTSSTLSDGKDYFTETSSDSSDTSETDNSSQPNAALYCQDDLTILGNGTLTVNGNAHNGITSKDILRITSGTINVNSKNHGITGKDNLAIEGGTLKITSGGDGIRSTYDKTDDSSKGHIFIENADINITSQNDGIQAEKNLIINSGTFNIKTGDGAESSSAKANSSTNNSGFHGFPNNTQISDSSTSVSQKGLKSGSETTINNGTFTLDTYDDAIHTKGNITITGGTFDIKTGDDAVHADDTLLIKNGTVTISQSYEGLEATTVNITGGSVDIKASDDGINSAGGNDSSGFGGFGGRPQDKFMNQNSTDNQTETDDTKQSSMTISGGTIYVNADGDGIDSNNKILISGGTIVINGTTSGGNGIIDHDGDCEITGGTLIGSGTYDMLEMPESTSTQNSVAIMMTEKQKADTPVYIADSQGNILVLMSPQKDYSCIVFSSPQLKTGETYTVYVGGTASGESTNGYYTQTSIKDGTKYTEFTISEPVTYVNENGVTTYSGMGGGKGNRQPMSPDGTKPDMPDGDRPEMPDNPPVPPTNAETNNV